MAVAVVGVQWRQSWRVWNSVVGRRGMWVVFDISVKGVQIDSLLQWHFGGSG
jgi:hypothetical protein